MANDIAEIEIGGSMVQAIEQDGKIWVPHRRMCENLGLDPHSQRTKLQGKPWATDAIITSVAEDGVEREMYCLEHKCIPMWLATIHTSKVKPEFRPRLEIYQCEAADVLADHFLRGELTHQAIDTRELVESLRASIIADVRAMMLQPIHPMPVRVADLVTVEERCRKRWPGASRKTKARIRDVACAIHNERLGYRPYKLTGAENGMIAFEREHLHILDDAIDIIMESVSGTLAAPLFQGRK